MKKSSTALLMNVRVLHYTFDMGSLLFKSISCILMLLTTYECHFFKYGILSLVFLSLKLYVH